MRGEEIFKMTQKEDESLENYISRFMYSLQRNTEHELNEEFHKLLFLRGIQDGCTEALDLMAGGDITQSNWDDIEKICLKYSRAIGKRGRGYKPAIGRTNGLGASKSKITHLLSDFKQDIIKNMAM